MPRIKGAAAPENRHAVRPPGLPQLQDQRRRDAKVTGDFAVIQAQICKCSDHGSWPRA
ncbi:hypothetical protein ACFMBG_21515 [Leisingera sp. D0M16]